HQQLHVDAVMALGCTLGEAAPTRFLGEASRPWPDCVHFRDSVARMLAVHDYDAIVIEQGHKDLGERRLDGRWRHLGDPVFDRWMQGQVATVADLLATEHVPVLWATLTHMYVRPGTPPSGDWRSFGDNDPDRVDRLNAIVGDAIADRPGFQVLDVAGW